MCHAPGRTLHTTGNAAWPWRGWQGTLDADAAARLPPATAAESTHTLPLTRVSRHAAATATAADRLLLLPTCFDVMLLLLLSGSVVMRTARVVGFVPVTGPAPQGSSPSHAILSVLILRSAECGQAQRGDIVSRQCAQGMCADGSNAARQRAPAVHAAHMEWAMPGRITALHSIFGVWHPLIGGSVQHCAFKRSRPALPACGWPPGLCATTKPRARGEGGGHRSSSPAPCSLTRPASGATQGGSCCPGTALHCTQYGGGGAALYGAAPSMGRTALLPTSCLRVRCTTRAGVQLHLCGPLQKN